MPSSAPDSPFPPRRLEVVPRHDTRAERVTTLRYFEGNVHRVAALAAIEGLVAWASVVAIAALAVPPLSDAALPVPPWQLGLLLSAGMMIALSSMGLYRLRQRVQMRGVLARLLVAAGGVFAGLELAYLLVPALQPARVTLLHAAVIALPGLALARFSFSRVVDQDVFKRLTGTTLAAYRPPRFGTSS